VVSDRTAGGVGARSPTRGRLLRHGEVRGVPLVALKTDALCPQYQIRQILITCRNNMLQSCKKCSNLIHLRQSYISICKGCAFRPEKIGADAHDKLYKTAICNQAKEPANAAWIVADSGCRTAWY